MTEMKTWSLEQLLKHVKQCDLQLVFPKAKITRDVLRGERDEALRELKIRADKGEIDQL